MRRLVIRLLILGVMGVGWAAYQLADVTDCSGPKSEAWANSTLVRYEQANEDWKSAQRAVSSSPFKPLATRAEQRYAAQKSQETPACLRGVQSQMTEAFYYDWKAFEAASVSNFDLAASYADRAETAMDEVRREIRSLAEQYGWDLTAE